MELILQKKISGTTDGLPAALILYPLLPNSGFCARLVHICKALSAETKKRTEL